MAASVPTEILCQIFERLRGVDVLECRSVCQRWRHVIDEYLGDSYWRTACGGDFAPVSEEAHDRSALTWRQLYRALDLWRRLPEAEATAHPRGEQRHNNVYIRNGVLTCHQRIYKDSSTDFTDAIVYYCMETLQKIHTEYSDVPFTIYDDNEHFLVLQGDSDGSEIFLHVTSKRSRRKIAIKSTRSAELKNWWLFDNELYVCGHMEPLRRLFLVETVDGLTANPDVVWASLRDVAHVARVGPNELYVYVKEQAPAASEVRHIVMHLRGDVRTNVYEKTLMNEVPSEAVIKQLKKYHFDLTFMSSGQMSLDSFASQINRSRNYGDVVFKLDSSMSNLTIHYKSSLSQRLVVSKRVEFEKLTEAEEFSLFFRIDVVETRKGHVVIIRNFSKMLFIELKHDCDDL